MGILLYGAEAWGMRNAENENEFSRDEVFDKFGGSVTNG